MHQSTMNTQKLKQEAEHIFHQVGLTSGEALRLFYTQVCLRKGLPFDVKIPNEKTIKAMSAADKRKTHKIKDIDELFESLN